MTNSQFSFSIKLFLEITLYAEYDRGWIKSESSRVCEVCKGRIRMAAIFGQTGAQTTTLNRIERMSAALVHRGATFDNLIQTAHGVIGSRRTVPKKSVDRANPFTSNDHTLHVVLDGLIVNVIDLRHDLEKDGVNFISDSDTEVIAALYRKYGRDCFNHLRGGYAIAIMDNTQRCLLLARDHLGLKPIFYADTNDGLIFASESKAILASGLVPFSLNTEALSHFLSVRFVPSPHSLIKGIRKLPPAHYLIHKRNEYKTRQYWSISFAIKHRFGHQQIIDGMAAKLEETIAAYLREDVTTGSFLSGGLDSGLIVANMAAILKDPFRTFSLGVANNSDEIPLARLVSKKFGTIQHESYPDENIVRMLPAMIWQLDEPSDMVVVSKYLIAKMAAPHVDAAMSGDGGDELFAGFLRYLGLRDARYFDYLPSPIRDYLIAPLARALGGRKGLKGIPGKILWLSSITAAGRLPERYAAAVEYLRFRKIDKQALFTSEIWRDISNVDSRRLLIDKVRQSDAEDQIEKLLHTDLLTRLPEHLLMLDDRTGAAHGVDVLCPFADKEIVEYATAIPANMKIRGRQAKYIEREIARKVLPKEVVNYQKTGWSFPFADLCAGGLRMFLRNVFAESRLVQDGIFSRTVY